MKAININISSKSIIMIFSFSFLIWVITVSKEVILILLVSFILASALLPSVDWLNKRMRRGFAVTIVILVGLISALTILIPSAIILYEQTSEFIKQLPSYTNYFESIILKFKLVSGSSVFLSNGPNLMNQAADISREIVNQSINLTINVFTWFITSFTLATIVLFILLDKKNIKEMFLNFFPPSMREKTETISKTIASRVGGYVRGQFFIMLAVGCFTSLGLLMLNVKYSLLLGLIAGIMEIIPIVGAIFATVLAMLVAFVQHPILAVWVLVLFIVIQRLQNSILTPLIFAKILDLSPILIIISLLFCASTLGVIGAILSPAIAAIIFVLVQELYLKKFEN